MTKKEREKKIKKLVDADDPVSVERAFLELMPTRDEDFQTAHAKEPMKFIAKLTDIGCKDYVKTHAARQYAAATIMSIRCERRRKISPLLLQEVDRELAAIYDEEDNALPRHCPTKEAAEDRGRNLYNGCMKRAESLPKDDFIIRSEVAKGEFHRLANGEGREKRDITWLRTN